MITDILRWGGGKLPNTRLVVNLSDRAVSFVQQRRKGVALGGMAAAGVVAMAACAAGYLHYSSLVTNERDAAIHAESANAALQDELGKLRDQLGAAKGRLAAVSAETQALARQQQQQQRADAERKSAAPEANPANKGSAPLNHALEQAQRELHLTEAQRATLMARVSKAETEAQQLQAERDKLAAERDALKLRVTKLEKQSLRHAPPAVAEPEPQLAAAAPRVATGSAVAVARPEPAAAAPAAAVVPHSAGAVGQVEKVLASAGVDVARLFSQFGVSRGEGGPFVPVAKGAVPPPSSLTPEKFAALRAMMKTLPVSAPLTEYEIGSGFGGRHDPFNGRSSFHTGLDLDAPYESPIYATAPGVVTYAGYRNDYGKIVEIDHGHGITTRYAHMHRYTVSVGERVAAHQQIGYLGSSGRATGPHVHYEVLVNGEPQDPTKFMQLGHIVPAARQR